MTWRVVVSGNSGDGFSYRIADLVEDHYYSDGRLAEVVHPSEAAAPEELVAQMRAMLGAFDLPYVSFLPARFQERPGS